MTRNHILIGKTINEFWIADDSLALKLVTDSGDIIANVDADCCSYTWIESVEAPDAAVGSPVLEAVNIDMPDLGTLENHDCMQYYGFRIRTAKGDCIIDYRNDSNGYYGGSLEWPGDGGYHYGGVFGQANSKHEWSRRLA